MRTVPVVMLMLSIVGCQSSAEKSAAAGATSGAAAAAAGSGSPVDREATAEFSGDQAGAKKLLTKLIESSAEREAIVRALQPDPADYAAVFAGDAAAKAQAAYASLWAQPVHIQPKEGQTELLLFRATTEDFQAGNDKAHEFPGGYKQITDKLKEGVVWYRWKFVEPGERMGLAFDGLVHVNGHWAWFPKPWRAVSDD